MTLEYHVLLKYPDATPDQPGQLKLFEHASENLPPISIITFEIDPTVTDKDMETRIDGAVNVYPGTDPGPTIASRWIFPDLSMIWEDMTPNYLADSNCMIPLTLDQGREAYRELLHQGYKPAPSCPLT